MTTFLRDIRLAFRLLAKDAAFTAIVILTLALGIGLNSAVFSTIDATLLRPLPGAQAPEELVQLYRTRPGMLYGSSSIPHFLDVRDRSAEVFVDVAAAAFTPLNLSVDGRPTRVMGQVVSANFFSLFGVRPLVGRTFVPAEDSGRGAHPVVVLSHGAWAGSFGADSAIVGRDVLLNGRTYQVIGVTPAEFRGGVPIVEPFLWAPLTQTDHLEPGSNRWEERRNNNLQVYARLKPGVTIERAAQRMTALVAELREVHPDEYRDTGIGLVAQADAGIHPMFRDAQVGLSAVIMGVVVLLLLIACVNVANLMLARARDRAREMAVRLSLGANRRILVRQLLTESVLLATLAGGAGLIVARVAMGIASRAVGSIPAEIQLSPGLELSPTVLLFTLGVALATGVLFGLVPALQATNPALVPALKGEAPAGGSRSRMSRGLVVAQVALSVVLLVSAGLFLRNLEAATSVDKGFITDNLLVADVDPGLQGYPRARTEAFYATLRTRLEALPGITAVAFADRVPLGLSGSDWNTEIPGYTPGPNERMTIDVAVVTPGYFEATGTTLLAGRGFQPADDSAAARTMVVNQRFAERFWPGQDPLGRTVRVGGRDHTVIGLTRTGKYRSLGEEPTPFMYVAHAQHWGSGMTMMLRTRSDPAGLMADLRREVAALDPDLPLANVQAMNNRMGLAFLPARLSATVLGVFGVLGLVLASLGVYGVMSRAVAQRRREIGIRLAIGAAGGTVVRLLLRDGLRLVGLGIGIGLIGALLGSRLLQGVLYGAALDPLTFVGVPLVLGLVGLVAIWVPARRAAAVNPVGVLRQE